MTKVLPAIFSYEDMKSKFAQDNPDDPYTRRADLESGIYALDSWLIRVDDNNKAISTVGFKEHPSHTVVGGMYASAKGKEIGGNNRALQIAREPQLNQSKPLVAAFGHRDGDNARWIAKAKQNGWKFPEDNDFQQVSQMLPEQIVNTWNSAYPNGNWAIRSIRGEGDFAKCVFIDDLMPAWFNLLKSKQGGREDIIKWLPSSEFKILLDSNGKRVVFKEKKRNRSKYDDRLFYHSPTNTWIRPHYFDKGAKRTKHQPYANDNTQINTWLEKLSQASFSGRAWFYVNDNPMDLSYVEVVNIPVGGKLPESINKVTNEKPVEGILFNSFRGSRSELDGYLGHIGESKLLDFWETGIKEGHKEGADMHNSRPKTPDDVRAKEKHEKVSLRLSRLLPLKTLDSNKNILGHYTSVLEVEDRLQELKDIPSIIERIIQQTKKNKREKKQKFLEKELPNEKEQLENFLKTREELIAEQRRLSGMFKKSWFDILRM
tara:strand:- start:2638 stop:4101 length:1464 start_codon:yes stop_codon:yes gene_type:complete